MNTTEQAVEALRQGALAILPTETVYGLFADAMNENAVKNLYAVKGRPTEKALNLNVPDFATILRFSQQQPAYLEQLVKAFLPGPLTLILQASDAVPDWIHMGKTTVGFRMPSVPATLDVIRQIGVLVGPSANLTGAASPRLYRDLTPDILSAAAAAICDDSVNGLDTTILDLSTPSPKILRQGAVTKSDIIGQIPEIGGASWA